MTFKILQNYKNPKKSKDYSGFKEALNTKLNCF
jgi:hypothetical protein